MSLFPVWGHFVQTGLLPQASCCSPPEACLMQSGKPSKEPCLPGCCLHILVQSGGVFAVFLSAWGEKFKETLSSFLASFPDGAAFSRQPSCPTTFEEIGVFPPPSLTKKKKKTCLISEGYPESRCVCVGRGPSEARGRSEVANTLAWGSLCQHSPVELDPRRLGEGEAGKERAPGAGKTLAPLMEHLCR